MDELARDGEAETGAAVTAGGGTISLNEGFEKAALRFGGDADAGITHGEFQENGFFGFADFGNLSDDFALRGEFDGVADEVREHLADAPGIAAELAGDFFVNPGGELDIFG